MTGSLSRGWMLESEIGRRPRSPSDVLTGSGDSLDGAPGVAVTLGAFSSETAGLFRLVGPEGPRSNEGVVPSGRIARYWRRIKELDKKRPLPRSHVMDFRPRFLSYAPRGGFSRRSERGSDGENRQGSAQAGAKMDRKAGCGPTRKVEIRPSNG